MSGGAVGLRIKPCRSMSAPSPATRPIRWRARPALLVAGGVALGIAVAYYAPGVSVAEWLAVASAAARL